MFAADGEFRLWRDPYIEQSIFKCYYIALWLRFCIEFFIFCLIYDKCLGMDTFYIGLFYYDFVNISVIVANFFLIAEKK